MTRDIAFSANISRTRGGSGSCCRRFTFPEEVQNFLWNFHPRLLILKHLLLQSRFRAVVQVVTGYSTLFAEVARGWGLHWTRKGTGTTTGVGTPNGSSVGPPFTPLLRILLPIPDPKVKLYHWGRG